jgi:methyltransferase-like protein
MEKKDDCPVSNELCNARMENVKTYVDGIKQTVKTTGAVITLIVSIVAILTRVL